MLYGIGRDPTLKLILFNSHKSKHFLINNNLLLSSSSVANMVHAKFLSSRLERVGSGCGSVGRAVASNTRGVHGTDPVIGKIYIEHFYQLTTASL